MDSSEKPLTPPQKRAKELVEHFGETPRPGIDCQTIQSELQDALTGVCAEALFGDQRVPLLERVQRMSETDKTDANATVYLFSRALLSSFDALFGRKIADATQSLRESAEAGAAS